MKKPIILGILALGLLYALTPKNEPDVRVYDYATITEIPNDFHEDYDSTFVDGTTDCIHFTFKAKHNCDFIENNPIFK